MLRAIRAKLREIRHHSAPRHDTEWHRAADVALWAALLLAWPATWLATQVVQAPGLPVVVQGRFGALPDGGASAWLLDAGGEGRIVGTFELSMVEHAQGWPFTTRRDPRPPRLGLHIFSEPAPRSDVRLERDDPTWALIEAALRKGGAGQMHAAWVQGDLPARSVWLAWITGTLVWWVILSFLLTGAVWVASYAWRVGRSREARRRARRTADGRCAACGYDLRGLEFNERCPECGAIT